MFFRWQLDAVTSSCKKFVSAHRVQWSDVTMLFFGHSFLFENSNDNCMEKLTEIEMMDFKIGTMSNFLIFDNSKLKIWWYT